MAWGSGVVFVETTGTINMPVLYVSNLDILHMVSNDM